MIYVMQMAFIYRYCRWDIRQFDTRTTAANSWNSFLISVYASSIHVLKLCWRNSWWRHQMETFSALLAICAGNSPVPGEFLAQRPVTRSFDVFFDLRLNKRLSKQSWGWWFETLSRPLWRHRNVPGGYNTTVMEGNHAILNFEWCILIALVIMIYELCLSSALCIVLYCSTPAHRRHGVVNFV